MARVATAVAALALVPVLGVSTSACLATPSAEDLVATGTIRTTIRDEDALAALRNYVAAVNTALARRGLEDLQTMTDPRCPCVALIEHIRERLADGGALEGARFRAGDLSVVEVASPLARVQARIAVSGYDVRSADGLVVRREPAREFTAVYTLRRVGDDWTVLDVERAPPTPE
ncbi:MAG: hypothetical protein M3P83_10410 [Actinomycetota bacterium]|nr:hypothetical protein [Actinomycetota bacterium]